MVNTLDSYTESSPSGKGIRVWVRAGTVEYDKARYYINNRKLHLEVYVPGATQHFLTLTGNAIRNKDVMERSNELQILLDKYMVRPDAEMSKTPLEVLGSVLTDVCRHTYCSNQAKAGMNPKTLQYLMGNSYIGGNDECVHASWTGRC